jgi:hypothetical protein
MLFVSLFVGMITYSGPASADIQGGWVEEIIRDVPTTVRGIDMGDVDGDGKNEVVVGLDNTASDIRMYEKENGIWKETLIDDTPAGLTNLVVGDADNDGLSEIICSLAGASKEVRVYEYSSGSWSYDTVTTAPSLIYDLEVGDANNDGWKEIVIAISNATTNDVRAYRKLGTWVEENITDAPFQVSVLDIGDADNDGNNEVVIGMTGNFPPPFPVYVPNEVRAYEKVGGNWIEDNITDTPTDDIISLVIGDHDGDGMNEVGFSIGDFFGNSEFRTYEYNGGWTMEIQYPSTPGNFFFMGGVGDTDNDGINEFITMEAQGMGTGQSNMIVWENMSYLYTGNPVRGKLPSRAKVVIGDGDNDGTSEIICGFITTTYEIRSYSNDRGKIRFTSHYNGEYVAGTEIIDVLVTSNFVDAVRFYIDNNLTFTDTKYPYQFILDTSTLVEDATYEIKAEGVRLGNGPLVATIDLRVNNLAPVGDYISVSTLKGTYTPDEDVSVLIGIKSPPSFSNLDLYVKYEDPSGNTLYSIGELLPYSNQYIMVLPLGSDAEQGTYQVTVDAYGITQDMMMWSASNTTTFDVAGRSIQEQLEGINTTLSGFQSNMTGVNISGLQEAIEYLNQTLNPKMDNLALQVTGVNNSLHNSLSNVEGNILGDLANVNASLASDIQTLLTLITADITGLNGSLSEQLANILENITTGNGALKTWLDTVLTQIDANITDTKNSLETQLTVLETTTQTFYDDILLELSEVFNSLAQLEGNLSLQHTAISDAIDNLNSTIADAPGLSTGDILDRINDSIAILEDLDSNMTSHDADIDNALNQLMFLVANQGNMTRDQLLQNVSDIMNQMQDLDADIVSHDNEVNGNLSTIEDLIGSIGAMDVSDIMIALADLEGNLTQIDNDMAQDVADIGQDVENFQTDTEDRLDKINTTLLELEKLDDIVADLEALETNVAEGHQQLEEDINEILTEKEEGTGSELTLMLVLMFIIMIVIMIMVLFMKGMGGKSGMGDHEAMMSMPQKEQEEITDDEGQGGWEEEETEEEDWEEEKESEEE